MLYDNVFLRRRFMGVKTGDNLPTCQRHSAESQPVGLLFVFTKAQA